MGGCLSARPFLLLIMLGLAPAATAQDEPRELVVGIKAAPPFAMKSSGGAWEGLTVDLMRDIGARLGHTLRFEEEPLPDILDGVAAGRLDVGAAALTVTPGREATLDFSHAYMDSGLAIAVPARPSSAWSAVASRFFSGAFLGVLATLAGLLLLVGFLAWLFERRGNEEEFGHRAGGIFSGFWWAAVTMTTVGYGDKSPRTLGGRAVALVWMFASIIVISTFTASIAAALTISELDSPIRGPEDLGRFRVATVADSTSAGFLRRRGVGFDASETLASALDRLAAGEVDCVVYDAPLLRYEILQGRQGELAVLPHRFERQQYALAFPPGSPLREPVNRVLLERISSVDWEERMRRYFGS